MPKSSSYAWMYICLRKIRRTWVRCRANEFVCPMSGIVETLLPSKPSRIYIQETTGPGILKLSQYFDQVILFHFSPFVKFISAEPADLWDPCVQGFTFHRHFYGVVHVSLFDREAQQEEFLILCDVEDIDKYDKLVEDRSQRYLFVGMSSAHPDFREMKRFMMIRWLRTEDGWSNVRNHLTASTENFIGIRWDDRTDMQNYKKQIVDGVNRKLLIWIRLGGAGDDTEDRCDMLQLRILTPNPLVPID
ncbi:hypothetical protein GGS24DRAFT_465717, partial [Hypoxylon argillaceum]